MWTSPPFDPAIRDGRIYARGASDMKGDLLLSILAVEALLKSSGALPANLKFLFEGQEEIGSPQLPAFVAAEKDRLACDLVLNADGSQWSETEPALLVGFRGLCGIELTLRGARSDLHSGQYGGAVQNPLHAMAQLLASFHTPDGRVAVDGFYADVVPPSPEERARMAAVPLDEAAYKSRLGIADLFGEPGYSTLERVWARPTLEVNGMWGGFQGEGVKTVLPNEAHAKITCRLVPDQDPAGITDLLQAHVAKHTPAGVKAIVRPLAATAKPYLVPADHPGNQAAAAVLEELYGRQPYLIREGGSVPVCEIFLRQLGVYSIGFGFGLPDEQIHAPNEFFRLHSFERGQVAFGMVLERLGA